MDSFINKGRLKIRKSAARLDRSLILVGVGLLIGASMGLLFNWLENSGRAIFGDLFTISANAAPPRVGSPAADFELFDLTGKPIRLSHLKGQPVFINFWATWCPPCRQEIPLIEEAQAQYPDLIILTIDADESEATVRAFASKYEMTTIVLLDPGAVVNDLYHVDGLPTSYFLDEEGVIRSAQIGQLSAEGLAEHLSKIGVSK